MAKKMGRPRKPTTLHIASGTHRKDRHGSPDNEPHGIQLTADTKPPTGVLSADEAKIWKTTLAILAPKHLATDLDIASILEYCRDLNLCQRIRKQIDRDGIIVPGVMGDKAHPLLTALNQTRNRVMQFESKFGMTPSDRAGMDLGVGTKSMVQRRARN